MKLQKHPDGSIHLQGLGLKLEVEPQWLLKESISKEAQAILDKLLEDKLRASLDDFIDSDDNTQEKRQKLYHKEEYSKRVATVAHLERDLIHKFHSDGECIELTDAQKEARSFLYSVWRFCTEYGYPSFGEPVTI